MRSARLDFIVVWDSLAQPDSQQFDGITNSSGVCMSMMNDALKDLNANPYWLKWIFVVGVTLLVAIVAASVTLCGGHSAVIRLA